MSKFLCPFCYETHDLKDCGMKCSFSIPGSTLDCNVGVPKDSEGWINPRFHKKCMQCKSAVKDIYCPTLDYVVPPRCIRSKSLPIALIGAKATGKSNYIGVLINEIKKKMSRSFDCCLNMTCDPMAKQIYDEMYYRPLYRERMLITATDSGATAPLIFPIDFQSGKRVTLTFYDTAGENLDDEQTIKQYNKYIPNAKGIILLLDPLQIPSIREELIDHYGVPESSLPEQNSDSTDILDRIIQFIENTKNNMKKFDIPIAVVFTKLDELFEYDTVLEPDNCLRSESVYTDRGVFVMDEFDMAHKAMLDLVEDKMPGDFVQKLKQRFKTYAFFGVSALGKKPEGFNLAEGGVQPIRVLDPLLWVLSENKYIKKVKS